MKYFNTEFFNYFKSFNFLSLINLFSFIKTIIINLFFKLESFLFGKKFGWNYNFLQIFNFIKDIFSFIWNQLTKLIPFLKICEPLYNFFEIIINVFLGNPVVDINGIVIYTGFRANLISLFTKIPELFSTEHLTAPLGVVGIATIGATLPVATSLWDKNIQNASKQWEGIKQDLGKITGVLNSTIEKGFIAIKYSLNFIFQAISFTFKITIIIGKFLITFLLKILDIFIILLKIWFHIIKNIFVIIKIIFIYLHLFYYLYSDSTTDDKLINVIRKELFKSKE